LRKWWDFSLQEILDQIADIDLVVNFKCGEGNVVKKNLISAENSSYSVADAGSVSNEKSRIYAQEVQRVLFHF
jgi:adenylate kinase